MCGSCDAGLTRSRLSRESGLKARNIHMGWKGLGGKEKAGQPCFLPDMGYSSLPRPGTWVFLSLQFLCHAYAGTGGVAWEPEHAEVRAGKHEYL